MVRHSFSWVFACAVVFPAALPTAFAVEPTNTWHLRGPTGGYAYQVAIDPVSQRPLAGGAAGLFRYDAVGGSWSYANTGAPTPYVVSIATTPTATFMNSGGYVSRSTDGGVTWTNVSDPAMGGAITAIATSPNAPSRVYATANPGGLFRSDNLGVTWTLSPLTAGATLSLVRVSPTNADLIFVANQPDSNGVTKLFRSADGGLTFGSPAPTPVCLTGGTPSRPLGFVDLAQDPFNASKIVALAAPTASTDHSDGAETWVSFDAGLTWGSPLVNSFVIAPETTGGGEPRAVLFDRFTPDVLYFATTWGLFKGGGANSGFSSAGMLQMGPRPSGATPYDEVDGLAQANDGALYAATTSGGVFKSSNSALNWTALESGYTGLNVRMFAFQPGNTGVVLAGSADPSNLGAVYRSVDSGMHWTRSSTGMNAGAIRGLAFSPTNPSIVLAGGFPQGGVGGESTRALWRSTDAGLSWAKIDVPGLRFNAKRIVAFDPLDGNKVLAASSLYLNLSTDAGLTWINSYDSPASFTGLPFTNNPNLTLLGLAAGPGTTVGSTRFYASVLNNLVPGSPLPAACQSNPSLPCKGGVYYSDNGGFNWTRGVGVTDDSANFLSVGAAPGMLFASQLNYNGYAGGVYKSTDYGATWTNSSTGLPCRAIFSVAADPTDPQVVWTGCAYTDIARPVGIFRSNDGGASWVPYGRGLRNLAITWLTVDPVVSGHVLAGGNEGINEMNFAPDADQDGIPDSEEATNAPNGDANLDGIPDATQAGVASAGTPGALLASPRAASGTAVGDYVVVEIDQTAPHTGTCQFVSDLFLVPGDQIVASNRMVQAAPTVRFILPNCQHATVKIRYSAISNYPVGVFGSFSPVTPGDAASIRWGLLDAANATQSGGIWSLQLDQNAYGNVYAPNSGSILFQGAPGKDSIFGNGFD